MAKAALDHVVANATVHNINIDNMRNFETDESNQNIVNDCEF